MSESRTKSSDPAAPSAAAGSHASPPLAAADPQQTGLLARTRLAVRQRNAFTRARALYETAQGVIAEGSQQAPVRAARLYRRALRLLDPQLSVARDLERFALRDAVKLRLRQHGVFGWIRRERRAVTRRGLALGLLLASLTALIPSWRQRVFPPDLADGKVWTTSSTWPGFAGAGTMTADTSRDPLFHTLEEPSPAVTLDLGSAQTVRSVEILNRTSCCRERVVPMVVELSSDGTTFQRVAYRRDTFSSWTAHVPPQRARFVRLRIERQSILHLRHISVY